MTGIIAAVIEEAEAIKKEIENIKEIVINEISFFTGKFNEKEIVFVQSGIGKVNAAITATLLIEKFNVKEVIFSGVAGSLDARLKIGDVVIGRDIVQHDVDATAFGYKMGQIPQMKEWAFESDKYLIEKTAKINNINHQILLGRILTGDQFISKKDVKIQLGKDFDALCVDMESGAVAQVCARLGIKFLIIRSISDSITDDSGMEYTSFVKLAAENSKKIRQLLVFFEMIDASMNYIADFSKVRINRSNKDYETIMQWSKVFLLNKSFTTFSGSNNSRALLFPMEKVYESYVAKYLKKILEKDGWDVSSQDRGYYLFIEPRLQFALIPDIICKHGKRTIIMDTKWKKLINNERINYGISQSDMYQMYAYSKKYKTSEIWLLYPLNDEMKEHSEISFNSGDGTTVNIYFVDLENIQSSLEVLRDKIRSF